MLFQFGINKDKPCYFSFQKTELNIHNCPTAHIKTKNVHKDITGGKHSSQGSMIRSGFVLLHLKSGPPG